ncbi:MAG: hypothetical protein NTV09_09060 [Bacteroidetes bacterium]|nr:hypothetical protein [Bacteroidota bacterium]
MRRILLSFCLILFSLPTLFAADNYPTGARSIGLANSSVTINDCWGAFQNQAALAWMDRISVGASYDNRFTISNLSTKGFVFALPVKAGTFALSGNVFGYSQYSEKKAGIAFAKKLGEKFSAGVQLDYLNTFINDDNYGSHTTFAVEAGLLAEPLKNFRIGLHVYNLSRAKLAEYADEKIPTIFRLGASYRFSEKLFWSIEEEKDIDQKAVFKSGLEYHVAEVLYLRGGISTNPTLFSFGFGLKMGNLMLDMASTYHQVLGFSPAVSLTYQFGKK